MKQDYIKKYINLFNNLNVNNVEEFDELVDKNILFSDPFNKFKGIKRFKNVFYHMFQNVKKPKFIILNYVINKKTIFLKWKMTFYAFKSKQIIEGVSEITLNNDGKIKSHFDYWDSLGGIFAKLPFIGIFYKISLKLFKVKN